MQSRFHLWCGGTPNNQKIGSSKFLDFGADLLILKIKEQMLWSNENWLASPLFPPPFTNARLSRQKKSHGKREKYYIHFLQTF